MNTPITRAVVIGAGTMGGGIAAHLANAGIPVHLLDIAPSELTSQEAARGATVDDAGVRNRIVRDAWDRLLGARPGALFTRETAARVTLGNLTDHADRISEGDWVVEAIVERLPEKRALMARIDALRKPDAIVSSNTSGLPITDIGTECSPSLRAHFLGTHFFNPARYMKLVEVIPSADTDPDVTAGIAAFIASRLGKGVALCKDTPNFIGNRYASIVGSMLMDFVIAHGYTVEESDAIMGPLVGRPKTAAFRLMDLVGADVAAFVNGNLYGLIPDDEARETLRSPHVQRVFDALRARGWLGYKTGSGFYRRPPKGSQAEPDVLDFETLDYRPFKAPSIPSLKDAAAIRSLPARLRFLADQPDKAGALVRYLWHGLAYMARRVPEISDDYPTVDRVVRWGFNHELGPFEMWDAFGFRETAGRMREEGIQIAPWVEALIESGADGFYSRDGARRTYVDVASATWRVEDTRGTLAVSAMTPAHTVAANASASLVDLGDGVLCLEVHSKLNTLDDHVVAMIEEATDRVAGREWIGLVVGNDAPDFGAGANLANLLTGIEASRWGVIGDAVARTQQAMQRMRTCPRPVVTAPAGRTLGGGCETALAGAQMVASAELYMGLVEVGVGLIPGAGGCKELVRRVVTPAARGGADVVAALQRVLQAIGMAKVSASAADARDLGFLVATDRVVMSRDLLVAEAKRAVLDIAAAGYQPPDSRAACFAAGRSARASLEMALHQMHEAGYATDYDRHVGGKVAHVICGGDLTTGQFVDEQYFLDLERETFISLCGEPRTADRIRHMLAHGKPLRN